MVQVDLYDSCLVGQVWQELSRLRTEKILCDVVFVAKDKSQIHAHGCVLAASSGYLKQMLTSNAHRPGFSIELPCLTGAAIDNMLQFLYTGHLKLEASHVDGVKDTAKALQMESLVRACTALSETRHSQNKKTAISLPKRMQDPLVVDSEICTVTEATINRTSSIGNIQKSRTENLRKTTSENSPNTSAKSVEKSVSDNVIGTMGDIVKRISSAAASSDNMHGSSNKGCCDSSNTTGVCKISKTDSLWSDKRTNTGSGSGNNQSATMTGTETRKSATGMVMRDNNAKLSDSNGSLSCDGTSNSSEVDKETTKYKGVRRSTKMSDEPVSESDITAQSTTLGSSLIESEPSASPGDIDSLSGSASEATEDTSTLNINSSESPDQRIGGDSPVNQSNNEISSEIMGDGSPVKHSRSEVTSECSPGTSSQFEISSELTDDDSSMQHENSELTNPDPSTNELLSMNPRHAEISSSLINDQSTTKISTNSSNSESSQRSDDGSPMSSILPVKGSTTMETVDSLHATPGSPGLAGVAAGPTSVKDELLDTSDSTDQAGEDGGSTGDQSLDEGQFASTCSGLAINEDSSTTQIVSSAEGEADPAQEGQTTKAYTGEITDGNLLLTEEVAMETDVPDDFITFAGVALGSETVVEVDTGYHGQVVEVGCHGQQEVAGMALVSADTECLSLVKGEEWMGESRVEYPDAPAAAATTQYVAVELQVKNESDDGHPARTALVTIPLGENGVVEKETLQAIFNQTSLPEQKVETSVLQLPFQCEVCEACFTTLHDLRQHIVRDKHSEQPASHRVCAVKTSAKSQPHSDANFVCTECGQNFKYKHNLKNHQLRHLEVKPFGCQHGSCKKQFASKNDLIVHSRSHTGARPYVCDYCNKAFTQSSNLLTHKRSVHNQEFLGGARNFLCSECQKSFKTKDMLNKHMKRHLLAFTCSQCDVKFRTRKDLRSHGQDTHNMEEFLPAKEDGTSVELYACPHCDKVYMDTTRLNEHITVVHNKEKRFSCPWQGCQYTAYYKYAIQRHYRVHETSEHERPDKETVYRCPHCTAPFNGMAGLRIHLKALHKQEEPVVLEATDSFEMDTEFAETGLELVIREEDPPAEDGETTDNAAHEALQSPGSPYQCDTCGAQLGSKHGLDKHRQLHEAKRDVYICRECTKTFTQKAHLQRHLVACHSRVKRYACEERACGYRCYYASEMREHYKHKHKRQAPVLSKLKQVK